MKKKEKSRVLYVAVLISPWILVVIAVSFYAFRYLLSRPVYLLVPPFGLVHYDLYACHGPSVIRDPLRLVSSS